MAELDPMVIAKMVEEILKWIADKAPFGIVHKTAPIMINGEKGLLVWDFLLWNELTFVDQATKSKQSLFNSASDKKTQAEFDRLVSKYGI